MSTLTKEQRLRALTVRCAVAAERRKLWCDVVTSMLRADCKNGDSIINDANTMLDAYDRRFDSEEERTRDAQ